MPGKAWGGRFKEKTDISVEAFTSSIDIDKRLYEYDIEGSIAHARMLGKQGIITEDEADALIQGLGKIKRDIENNHFEFDDSLEDIHMHIEHSLFMDVGKAAQKLHTARSRNDQIALDIRMYLREETNDIIEKLMNLRDVLVDLSQKHIDVVVSGYTHLQRAQPILLSHHFMAYYEMFKRDHERFEDCLKRINIMPLGSAALAGTTYPIDREYTAKLLDFPKVSANSMDSVADRDFIIEFLSNASICMMHLSRFAEELILWSSYEFGFVTISDAFTTGSSIMPQKKNPDVAELVRGKTGLVYGSLVSILTLMKGLPLTYNRDMQEDKSLLFESTDTLKACVNVFAKMLANITVHKDVMEKTTAAGFINATDMADYLVVKGMPFREAHSVVGKAVAHALDLGKELHELTLPDLKKFSDLLDKDIFDFLSTKQMISRRTSYGGTAKSNVLQAIETAQKELEELKEE